MLTLPRRRLQLEASSQALAGCPEMRTCPSKGSFDPSNSLISRFCTPPTCSRECLTGDGQSTHVVVPRLSLAHHLTAGCQSIPNTVKVIARQDVESYAASVRSCLPAVDHREVQGSPVEGTPCCDKICSPGRRHWQLQEHGRQPQSLVPDWTGDLC